MLTDDDTDDVAVVDCEVVAVDDTLEDTDDDLVDVAVVDTVDDAVDETLDEAVEVAVVERVVVPVDVAVEETVEVTVFLEHEEKDPSAKASTTSFSVFPIVEHASVVVSRRNPLISHENVTFWKKVNSRIASASNLISAGTDPTPQALTFVSASTLPAKAAPVVQRNPSIGTSLLQR